MYMLYYCGMLHVLNDECQREPLDAGEADAHLWTAASVSIGVHGENVALSGQLVEDSGHDRQREQRRAEREATEELEHHGEEVTERRKREEWKREKQKDKKIRVCNRFAHTRTHSDVEGKVRERGERTRRG